MMSPLAVIRRVATFLVFCGIFASFANRALGIDQQVLRLLTAWREYEGVEVKGTVYQVRNGEKTNKRSFIICRGTSTNEKVLRPKSVATLISNPGEPHLKSDMIIDRFMAANNGVNITFRRNYISGGALNFSGDSPGWRTSNVTVQSGNFLSSFGSVEEHASFLDGLVDPDFSGSGCSDELFGILNAVEKDWEFSIKEEVECLGFKGKVVEACNRPSVADSSRVVTFRTIVAFEPSVRILKYLEAECATPELVRASNVYNAGYRIKKLEVVSGLLIPTILELGSETDFRRFEVTDVNRLPADYRGLWEFDGPTGTYWSGDLLPTIRKPGVHQKSEVGAGLEIPFTEEEEEAIRRYLVSKNTPVIRQGVQWTSVLFYVSSLFVLICVSLLIYRNVRIAT